MGEGFVGYVLMNVEALHPKFLEGSPYLVYRWKLIQHDALLTYVKRHARKGNAGVLEGHVVSSSFATIGSINGCSVGNEGVIPTSCESTPESGTYARTCR